MIIFRIGVEAILDDGRFVSSVVVQLLQTLDVVQVADAQLFHSTFVDEFLTFAIDFHRFLVRAFGPVENIRIDVLGFQVLQRTRQRLANLLSEGHPWIVRQRFRSILSIETGEFRLNEQIFAIDVVFRLQFDQRLSNEIFARETNEISSSSPIEFYR